MLEADFRFVDEKSTDRVPNPTYLIFRLDKQNFDHEKVVFSILPIVTSPLVGTRHHLMTNRATDRLQESHVFMRGKGWTIHSRLWYKQVIY